MSETTLKQLDELRAQAKAGRITRENLQAFLRNPNRVKEDGVSEDGSARVYPITVDYQKTVKEMLEAGQYGNCFHPQSDDINDANFPISGAGVVEVSFELVHLIREVNFEEAFANLEARLMRPATIQELLAFASKYRKSPVVALGSVWKDHNGNRRVPCHYTWGTFNQLHRVSLVGDHFDETIRFLAVRK